MYTNFCSLLLEDVGIPVSFCFLARVVYHIFSCFFLCFKINVLSTVSVFLSALSYLLSWWSWTSDSVLTSIYNAEFLNNMVLDEYSKITACHFNVLQSCHLSLRKTKVLTCSIFFHNAIVTDTYKRPFRRIFFVLCVAVIH